MFEVGDKVKCVNTSPVEVGGFTDQCGVPKLVLGQVYTLRHVAIDKTTQTLAVKLEGVSYSAHGESDWSYFGVRFRKLPEIKSGLERLQAIINGEGIDGVDVIKELEAV